MSGKNTVKVSFEVPSEDWPAVKRAILTAVPWCALNLRIVEGEPVRGIECDWARVEAQALASTIRTMSGTSGFDWWVLGDMVACNKCGSVFTAENIVTNGVGRVGCYPCFLKHVTAQMLHLPKSAQFALLYPSLTPAQQVEAVELCADVDAFLDEHPDIEAKLDSLAKPLTMVELDVMGDDVRVISIKEDV